jgi:hypothetical protein
MPDWAMLDGCFKEQRNVSASDLDGHVYQNKRHLFLEKKRPYASLTGPQLRSMNNLVSHGNTFVAIWCNEINGSDITALRIIGPDGDTGMMMGSLKNFREAVRSWWLSVYNGSMD